MQCVLPPYLITATHLATLRTHGRLYARTRSRQARAKRRCTPSSDPCTHVLTSPRCCHLSSARSQHPRTTCPSFYSEPSSTRAATPSSRSSWYAPRSLSSHPTHVAQFSGLLSASILFDLVWVFNNDQSGLAKFLLFFLWLLKARAHTHTPSRALTPCLVPHCSDVLGDAPPARLPIHGPRR